MALLQILSSQTYTKSTVTANVSLACNRHILLKPSDLLVQVYQLILVIAPFPPQAGTRWSYWCSSYSSQVWLLTPLYLCVSIHIATACCWSHGIYCTLGQCIGLTLFLWIWDTHAYVDWGGLQYPFVKHTALIGLPRHEQMEGTHCIR